MVRGMSDEGGLLARAADRFTGWAERWIPDAFVFALVATVIVLGTAIVTEGWSKTDDVLLIWGKGFFSLLSFTMQMSLVVIAGYVLATTRPVHALIRRLASLPRSPRAAVAFVALVAMLTSWINWGFSLMFSAMLAKEIARQVRVVDYRALAAASFLGLGSIWAQGLSGSAALQMATPTALPQAIRRIVEAGGAVPGGVIPLEHTIFLWQSLVSCVIEIAIVTLLMYFMAPTGERARTAESMGIDLGTSPGAEPDPAKPGARAPSERLEHSPITTALIVAAALAFLVLYFARAERVLHAITLDIIVFAFLTAGMALHGTPARLMRAVRDATPAVWGIVLQFPFYAGMAAIISETHLNERIASWFVRVSTPGSYPALIATYSAALGVFVPSGGSKWVIEAPYVMKAAHVHHVHLGWMVAVYDLGEALANLIQPFWMLPILGLFGLRARDVMGYTFLVFLVLAPIVLVLVTLFGATLHYPL